MKSLQAILTSKPSRDIAAPPPFVANILTTSNNSSFYFATSNGAGPAKFFRIHRAPLAIMGTTPDRDCS
jgi:hypothetical protein